MGLASSLARSETLSSSFTCLLLSSHSLHALWDLGIVGRHMGRLAGYRRAWRVVHGLRKVGSSLTVAVVQHGAVAVAHPRKASNCKASTLSRDLATGLAANNVRGCTRKKAVGGRRQQVRLHCTG